MDKFSQAFEAAIPTLREQILAEFKKQEIVSGFRSIWESFETVVNPILISFLEGEPLSIQRNNIREAKSKSVYPDLKVLFEGKQYAIDVKSGEDHIDPWYDIGRLDTFEQKRLDAYAAEYSVVVRWRGRDRLEIPNVYIEPTYRTVGYRELSGGVLYRPYDGKVRPKSWDYFEKGESYWRDEKHFLHGLNASKNFRRKSFIGEWYKEMDEGQRGDIKEVLALIDEGTAVQLDDVPIDESE